MDTTYGEEGSPDYHDSPELSWRDLRITFIDDWYNGYLGGHCIVLHEGCLLRCVFSWVDEREDCAREFVVEVPSREEMAWFDEERRWFEEMVTTQWSRDDHGVALPLLEQSEESALEFYRRLDRRNALKPVFPVRRLLGWCVW